MDPRAGLDWCGKSRPSQGFDPRTIQPLASPNIPTTVPQPTHRCTWENNIRKDLIYVVGRLAQSV